MSIIKTEEFAGRAGMGDSYGATYHEATVKLEKFSLSETTYFKGRTTGGEDMDLERVWQAVL
jgi:hypothetical protein